MKVKVLMFVVVVITLFGACSAEPFPPGLDDYRTYGAATTLVRDESGEVLYMTDDSLKLIPYNTISAADSLLNKRYYLEFQIYENIDSKTYEIIEVSVQRMLLENVCAINDKSELNRYSNDCITPIWLWSAYNYVNLLCNINASNEVKHDFYLIEDKSTSNSDTINFFIRYDDKNDSYGGKSKAALSFDISSLVTNVTDSIVLTFKINSCDYDGDYDMSVTYKNSSNNDDSISYNQYNAVNTFTEIR